RESCLQIRRGNLFPRRLHGVRQRADEETSSLLRAKPPKDGDAELRDYSERSPSPPGRQRSRPERSTSLAAPSFGSRTAKESSFTNGGWRLMMSSRPTRYGPLRFLPLLLLAASCDMVLDSLESQAGLSGEGKGERELTLVVIAGNEQTGVVGERLSEPVLVVVV